MNAYIHSMIGVNESIPVEIRKRNKHIPKWQFKYAQENTRQNKVNQAQWRGEKVSLKYLYPFTIRYT